MKRILLFLLTFNMQIVLGQNPSVCIDSLFDIFKTDVLNDLEKHEGDFKMEDYTKESYYALLKHAHIDSLVKYMQDSVPGIRNAMYSGLAMKGADQALMANLLRDHKETPYSIQAWAEAWFATDLSMIG